MADESARRSRFNEAVDLRAERRLVTGFHFAAMPSKILRLSRRGENAGAVAGQTVGHVNVHVIPRYAGDGLAAR